MVAAARRALRFGVCRRLLNGVLAKKVKGTAMTVPFVHFGVVLAGPEFRLDVREDVVASFDHRQVGLLFGRDLVRRFELAPRVDQRPELIGFEKRERYRRRVLRLCPPYSASLETR